MKPIKGHYFLLIIAISVTLAMLFTYLNMRSSLKKAVTTGIEDRQQARSAMFNEARKKVFLETYMKTKADWARLETFFVNPDDMVSFIEQVEAIGRVAASDVSLSSLDADRLESAPRGTIGEVKAVITSSGSWTSMMKVLRLAEALPYKVSIDNVRLEQMSGGDKQKGRIWTISFNLKAAMLSLGSAQ